jgi:hypothetical protein
MAMKKLNPPTPLVPACPPSHVRVHLVSQPDGNNWYRDKEQDVMLFVPTRHRARFLALVKAEGGLHHGTRDDNASLRALLASEQIEVLGEDLEVWEG